MAELALAIIPIGLKICSGLVSYLSGLKDHGDALTRVTRQAESLEGSFRLLDTFLKRGQLEPAYYEAASHIIVCLKSCEEGLEALTEFERSQRAQNRFEHGIQKLCYPLRQAQLEQLESTLNSLCQPLSLAIQNLQLEIDVANSSALTQNTKTIQRATDIVSNLHTAVTDLASPINTIHSQMPSLQSSVDTLIPRILPQINLAIESHLRTQMEEIRQSFQETESAAIRRQNTTNELLSQLTTPYGSYVDVVGKIASRPSVLAELASSVSACSCQMRRSSVSKAHKFGSLRLRDDVVTESPHQENCAFFVANLESSQKRTLSFTGIAKLLHSAIQLSLCTTTGAGGFSISPSLRYFQIVDEKTAPAFQVLDLVWFYGGYKLSKTEQEFCLKAVLQKLQEIFRSGRANPTDVNQGGYSMLHMLARAINVWRIQSLAHELTWELDSSSDLEALFGFLIALGTPVALTSFCGQLAFHIAAYRDAVPPSVLGRLCIDDADPTVAPRYVGDDASLERMTQYGRENATIIEALLGPLTLAIIRSDKKTVEQLVSRYPESLEETNFFGATPLYFAVEKPHILEILVNRASPAQLVRSTLLLSGNMTPLGRAIKLSGTICNSQESDDGSHCPCVAAVKILLDADCPIIPERDFMTNPADTPFSCASKHCKALVSQSLRNRRRELKNMARKRLPKSEYRHFTSSAGELDFYAVELYRLLYRKGFTSFGRLSAVMHDEIDNATGKGPVFKPVYLYLASPEDASIFLDLGFLDVNPPCESIRTHLDYFDIKRLVANITPQYAIWLHRHCPCLWDWIFQFSQLKGFNFILADISCRHMFNCRVSDNEDGIKECMTTTVNILGDEATNKCSCLCSPAGFMPFDLVAMWLVILPATLGPIGLSGLIPSLLKDFGEVLTLDHLTCVVRQATFKALGMTHTCFAGPDLNIYSFKWQLGGTTWEDEELHASMDDNEKAVYLNILVTEFRDFMLNHSKVVEHGLLDDADTPNRCKGNEKVFDHQRALVFWDEIWPKRVREIEESLEATWNPDPEVLKDLCVSIWYEEDEEDDTASETLEDERTRLFDEFMENLEKI